MRFDQCVIYAVQLFPYSSDYIKHFLFAESLYSNVLTQIEVEQNAKCGQLDVRMVKTLNYSFLLKF